MKDRCYSGSRLTVDLDNEHFSLYEEQEATLPFSSRAHLQKIGTKNSDFYYPCIQIRSVLCSIQITL